MELRGSLKVCGRQEMGNKVMFYTRLLSLSLTLFCAAQLAEQIPTCVTLTIVAQGEAFQSKRTNLHDAARCVAGSVTSLGGIVAAATPDPRTAVLPVPSVGVNSLGPVDLAGGGHLQIRPRAGWGKWGRVAGKSRRAGRALRRRRADGGVQKMSRRGV